MPSKEASSPASNSGGNSPSCGLTGPPEVVVCSGAFSESCFRAEVGGALALVTTAAAMGG